MRASLLAQLAAFALAGVVVGACGGDDEGETRPPAAEACAEVQAPPPKEVELKKPDELKPPPDGTTAKVETSCGAFEIALDTSRAPKTTASFAHLVEEGVYDGTTFHRIVPDFVVQGGDPKGDGTGGPGYFVDEPPPQDLAYTRGTVAMAKTMAEPPGRSGSQFFVVTAPADAGLSPDYALLGEVSEGMGVVERIETLGDPGSGEEGEPTETVVIERVTLREG
jgi:peptidyl-prolyl cis-trans isomerase B (cyclophilin B)